MTLRSLTAVALALFLTGLSLPGVARAEDQRTVEFANGQSRHGVVTLDPAQTGIFFLQDGLETGMEVHYDWADLSADTLVALGESGYPVPQAARHLPSDTATVMEVRPVLPAVLGVKLTTKEGESVTGMIDAQFSTERIVHLLTPGGRRGPFPRDEVRMESVSLAPQLVYPPEELYRMLLSQGAPQTADDHRFLGDQCLKLGLREQALRHYGMYELLQARERPEGRVVDSLRRIRQDLADAVLRDELYTVGKHILDEEYDRALHELREATARGNAPEGVLAELNRVAAEVSLLRERTITERVIDSWEAFQDALLRSWAVDRGLAFADAFAATTRSATAEIRRRVAEKFSLSEEAVARIWADRPSNRLHESSYGDGTWLVEMPDLGGQEEWWTKATNDRRYAFLRAVHAEDQRRVIRTGHKGCTACGGTGLRGEFRGEGLPGGAEPPASGGVAAGPGPRSCPTCRGLRHERYVLYR
ncbi:MAG: hypothetical protein HYY93_14450 [Planctomycetes bacterium]|nr:hypothetical protein [Planctomycetota bacterium]